ncbi:hypothetical protein RRG08_008892 [Elysia crispata]|uniref:Uncharacterized protein n=1 Tax=Elysia crispata TaxID=231223 RepID=A0AAE0ZX21_9GAST|nr:hypothetical protein RRG08_008892 [Elysia crispata]
MVKKMKRLERQESRTVSKKCPDCDQQCAIALRSCTNCNYSFTKTRPHRAQTKQRSAAIAAAAKVSKASTSTSAAVSIEPDANLDKVGRRFRTKRMRPDFFNSLELDYASRTFRQRKPTEEKDLKGKKKRGRPKGSATVTRKPKEEKKKEEEEPLPELDDLYANFSQERLQQFSYILDELNCKMAFTMFKPA